MNRLLHDLGRRMFPAYHALSYGFEPDPWQKELLENQHRRVIVCCGRQVGKSKTTAMLARQTAETKPNSLTLVIGPAERQSVEFHRKTNEDHLKEDEDYGLTKVADNQKATELSNGSRIIALPGKEETIKGYSAVDLLIIDEAAYVPDYVWIAVKPMVMVSRGRVVILSTPRSKEGFFYDIWQDAQKKGSRWHPIHITTEECPRIPVEDIEEARSTYPSYAFQREYMAEFTDHEDSLFSNDDLDAMFSDNHGIQPLADTDLISPYLEQLFEEPAWAN